MNTTAPHRFALVSESTPDLDRGEVVDERWATVGLAALIAVLLFWRRRRRLTRQV